MQLKTILNYVERHKSFVYGTPRWFDPKSKTTIDIPIKPRANSKLICSGCDRPGSCYDHLPERRFEYVPLWGIAVYFVYIMRRVDCKTCGVKVERVPWGDGKNSLTTTYRWFLANWAKQLSCNGVAESFDTTWQNVFRSVKHAVLWGLEHRDLEGIEAIGVDAFAMATRAQVPDVGLPNRFRMQTAPLDWPASNSQGILAIFPDAWQKTYKPAEVCLQRYVASVPEGDCQESAPGNSCA